jgi:hypothetical protein
VIEIPVKRRLQHVVLLAFMLSAAAAATTGGKVSAPVDAAPSKLKPGQFIWAPQAVPSGPLVMVIGLDKQLAYVYRNGLRIGVSTISTGKKGKETPTGVFTILQKQKIHRSSLYDDAPMPFMQRLTWDGVAMHAGNLPGYAASHGCVRLPYEFARRLYEVTSTGMTVVVAAAAGQNAELARPELFASAPVGAMLETAGTQSQQASQAYRWTPEKAPTGPLTILVSTADRVVLVMRNGIEIGRASVSIAGDAPFGTEAYVMLAGDSGTASNVVPGKPGKNWQSIPLPGYAARPGTSLDAGAFRRVAAPPVFASLVYEQMVAGTTLLLTDESGLPRTEGATTTVITAEGR